MAYLTRDDRVYVRELKRRGVLRVFKKKELGPITKNGGVGIFCGDGDIDAPHYHRTTITHRPHMQGYFGGVLVFARSFEGYNPAFAEGAIENMLWGMGAKNTQSLFLYPHYPCGVAEKFEISIQGVIHLAAESHFSFLSMHHFVHVHSFFHVKRINRSGEEEQNTYIFYPELL